MLRYFVFANLWLLITLCLFLGKTFERGAPERYSFMGYGAWLSPEIYHCVIGVSAMIAAACFIAWWRTSANCPRLNQPSSAS